MRCCGILRNLPALGSALAEVGCLAFTRAVHASCRFQYTFRRLAEECQWLFTGLASVASCDGYLLLKNAKVYTVSDDVKWAQAILINEDTGLIESVGSDETVTASAPEGTEEIDMEGKLVLPGFQGKNKEDRTICSKKGCKVYNVIYRFQIIRCPPPCRGSRYQQKPLLV